MWEAAPLLCSLVLSGCFRTVPLGFRAESGYRPRSYRGWVGGTLYPSSAPAGAPAAPGRSASPCFAAESARVGTLMSLPEGIATLGSGEVRAEGQCRPKVTSGCPKRSEGGCPCRNEDEHRPSSRATYINEERSVRITQIQTERSF